MALDGRAQAGIGVKAGGCSGMIRVRGAMRELSVHRRFLNQIPIKAPRLSANNYER